MRIVFEQNIQKAVVIFIQPTKEIHSLSKNSDKLNGYDKLILSDIGIDINYGKNNISQTVNTILEDARDVWLKLEKKGWKSK
jgi:hypothetical protein